MTVEPKTDYRKLRIILVCVALMVFWRYSYFLFTPDVFDKTEAVSKKNLSPQIIEELFIDIDTIKNSYPDGQFLSPDAFKGRYLAEVKVERSRDFVGLAKINTITSNEFGWKREFSDYYGMGGIVSSNDRYLVILLNRKSDFRFEQSINVMSGYSGPPVTIYFFYNTSKIGYADIYILNRKTGETVKRYRFDDILSRSYYSNIDDTFYFRFSDDNIYQRLKID